MEKCKIKQIGKYRNGKPKFWCSSHQSIFKHGNNSVCEKASVPTVEESEKLYLDPNEWKGGVGLWGSLNAVYKTSRFTGHNEEGIHVHARNFEDSEKKIDDTFKEIYVKSPTNDLFNKNTWIKINSEIATAYTASMVTGKKMKFLKCKHCETPHIDSSYFAVTYHKKHFCTYCGKEFRDSDEGISNPIMMVKELLREYITNQSIEIVDRELNINQSDYAGGIEIWGSNPAIVWTAERSEEAGIHIHVYKDDNSGERIFDDTYGSVTIDGIELNDTQIRYLMVQNSLEFLNNKVKSLNCPECDKKHFDTFDFAIRPHKYHLCEYCSAEFSTPTKCIGNPVLESLEKLQANYDSLQKK